MLFSQKMFLGADSRGGPSLQRRLHVITCPPLARLLFFCPQPLASGDNQLNLPQSRLLNDEKLSESTPLSLISGQTLTLRRQYAFGKIIKTRKIFSVAHSDCAYPKEPFQSNLGIRPLHHEPFF